MRRRAVGTLVLILGAAAAAEVGIGASLHLKYNTRNADVASGPTTVESKSDNFSFGISPSVMILAGSRLEIVPRIGFEVSSSSHTTTTGTMQNTVDDPSNYGFGFGCGFFFRLAERPVLRLSLGPDVGLWFGLRENNGEYLRLTFEIGMPVNIDFILTENLFFRMSPKFLNFSLRNEKTSANTSTRDIDWVDIDDVWMPVFGFYVTF